MSQILHDLDHDHDTADAKAISIPRVFSGNSRANKTICDKYLDVRHDKKILSSGKEGIYLNKENLLVCKSVVKTVKTVKK